jgi:hypothetical protein
MSESNANLARDGRAIEMVHYPMPEDALAAAGISRGRLKR